MTLFIIIILFMPTIWIFKLFIYEPIKSNKIYELFKLRSQISLEAMKGNIEETDEDYKLLIYLINSEINIEKKGATNFSITNYIEKVIAPPVNDSKSAIRFNHLCENKQLLPYTIAVSKILGKQLNHRLKVLKLSIRVLYGLMCVIDIFIHHNIQRSKQYKTHKIQEYNDLQDKYSDFLKYTPA